MGEHPAIEDPYAICIREKHCPNMNHAKHIIEGIQKLLSYRGIQYPGPDNTTLIYDDTIVLEGIEKILKG